MTERSTDEEAQAAAALVELVLERATLDPRRTEELLRSTAVRLRDSTIEIDFGYLCETTRFEWSGEEGDLRRLLKEAAGGCSLTLDHERKKFGRTPWDA